VSRGLQQHVPRRLQIYNSETATGFRRPVGDEVTDGQVLVFHDLLGIRAGAGAKFVRRYADLQDAMDDGVAAYAKEVRSKVFPATEHGYGIDGAELARFRTLYGESASAGGDLGELA